MFRHIDNNRILRLQRQCRETWPANAHYCPSERQFLSAGADLSRHYSSRERSKKAFCQIVPGGELRGRRSRPRSSNVAPMAPPPGSAAQPASIRPIPPPPVKQRLRPCRVEDKRIRDERGRALRCRPDAIAVGSL